MQVVRLGAWCDVSDFTWRMPTEERPIRTLSVDVHEFTVLDDGRRLTMHQDKGWNSGIFVTGDEEGAVSRDFWERLTENEVRRDVLADVAGEKPDEGTEPVVDIPYEWLTEPLTHHDVHVTPDELRGVPLDVELVPHLLSYFHGTPPQASPSCLLRGACTLRGTPGFTPCPTPSSTRARIPLARPSRPRVHPTPMGPGTSR